MADIDIYNPDGLAKPLGPYSHVARAKAAETIYIAGQLSVNSGGTLVGDGDFAAQCMQVYANIKAALSSANADWRNVVQLTTYVVDAKYLPDLMAFRTREFPKMFPDGKYPPNTLLVIKQLANEKFLLEVQAVAAI